MLLCSSTICAQGCYCLFKNQWYGWKWNCGAGRCCSEVELWKVHQIICSSANLNVKITRKSNNCVFLTGNSLFYLRLTWRLVCYVNPMTLFVLYYKWCSHNFIASFYSLKGENSITKHVQNYVMKVQDNYWNSNYSRNITLEDLQLKWP